MATIDDDLAKAVTEGFRQAQIDVVNQDLILSGTGDVTVTLADGSKKTGPSWSKLIIAATAAGTSAAAAKTSETNALASKNAAATSATNAATSEGNALASKNAAKTSETNAKTSETNAKTSETNAAASASSAAASLAAAQLLTSVPYEDTPFPDVWLPLNDSMVMLAGNGPYDRISIGSQYIEMPSRSASFTRASTATYIDKSGVLQTATINEPRFEKEGLLIEGQSTNYFLYSNNPSNWVGIDPTLNKTFGPMGNTQAPTGSFVVGTAKVDAQVHQSNSLNLTAGQSITISCRVKGTVGMLRIRIAKAGAFYTAADVNLATGQVTTSVSVPMQSSSFLDSDGFYNITATLDITSDDIYVAQLRLRETTSDSNMTVGATLDLQMPQIEIGKFKTSFIITDASTATRAADDCTLQRSGNDNYFGSVTIAAEVHCNGPTSTAGTANRRGIISIMPSNTEYVVLMVDNSSATLGRIAFAYGGSSFNMASKVIDDGNMHIVCARSNTSQNQCCVDGEQLSNPTAVSRPTPGTVTAANQVIMIGRGAGATAPGQRMLNGHIRNLRIWHRALSDNQIKGIR